MARFGIVQKTAVAKQVIFSGTPSQVINVPAFAKGVVAMICSRRRQNEPVAEASMIRGRACKCRPFKDEVDNEPVHGNLGIRIKTESATTDHGRADPVIEGQHSRDWRNRSKAETSG